MHLAQNDIIITNELNKKLLITSVINLYSVRLPPSGQTLWESFYLLIE
nr:MAG TPA: hypothetical protein [Caudoviricetes sp.]